MSPDKIESKKEMPNYQLKIADFYNIPIGNVTKLVPNFFDKGNYVLHYENLRLYLRLGLKLKNISCIRIQSITRLKPYAKFNTQKSIEAERNDDEDGRSL